MDDNSKNCRGRGRPSLEKQTRQVNVRLDDDTIKRLEDLANNKGKRVSVNQFIKEITINYLNTLN